MNKLEYPEVSLYKLRLLSKGEESLIVTRRDEKQHFYNVSLDTIGKYYSLEEAEAALKTHKETDKDVIVYQIIGPEHGHGNSTFVESEIDGIPDEIFEQRITMNPRNFKWYSTPTANLYRHISMMPIIREVQGLKTKILSMSEIWPGCPAAVALRRRNLMS